ncbi:MAG: amidohydrolase family protein [Saprospiraceae bacterium]|nr:amidohydrolase family protein [Saprospiraceae bacterium]MCB9324673.1 amidohydrolase family protein [Lewinellaceae bacterium]
MKIDAHNHFWEFDPVRDAWIDASMKGIRRDFLPLEFKEVLERNGLDGTVAVQADQSRQETLFLLDLAEKNDFIKGVVGWVDLQAEDIEQQLEQYEKFPLLKGFRHIAQAEKDDFLVSGKFVRGMAALAATDFTFDLLVYPNQLPAAVELAGMFPNQPFVLDHIAKPLIKKRAIDGWKKGIRELAAHENVMCKISGLVTEADWEQWEAADFSPYLEGVTEAFGTERLMFGSDWPVCLLAAEYSRVLRIVEDHFRYFSESEINQFFGENAITFYNL